MESSIRLLHSSHRHLHHPLLHLPLRRTFKSPQSFHRVPIFLHLHNKNSNFTPKFSNPNSSPTPQFQNPNYFPNFPNSNNQFAHIFSSPSKTPFSWHYSTQSSKSQPNSVPKVKDPVITAVLLGWLGSKQKHLRRYVELYNARGVHAVTFVAGVGDVLSIDLGKKLEERIGRLASELANWVLEKEEDGRDRVLMFHTFSNTGWLA